MSCLASCFLSSFFQYQYLLIMDIINNLLLHKESKKEVCTQEQLLKNQIFFYFTYVIRVKIEYPLQDFIQDFLLGREHFGGLLKRSHIDMLNRNNDL